MGFWSGDLRERLFLEPHVGVDIDLGRLHGFMPKPERDHGLVYSVMKQFHRRAVPQSMRRNTFACEAWTRSGCREAVLAHQMFKRITTEPLAPDRGEQGTIAVTSLPNPALDQFCRVAAKWSAAFFSPLADATDVGACAKDHVLAAQTDQLGCPQSGLKRKQEQGVITLPHPRCSIRRDQQRGYLLCVEERHATLHLSLAWHRENALAMEKPGRIGHRDVSEE